ncbi:MAG: VRR-NUC domain-containing protein [Treponema sp.]|nr:VRR-NUC domain-containing protein [Treponema sp.]
MRYLQVRGIYHWRNSVGSVQIRPGQWYRFGKIGSSDILGLLPGGRFLAVECKAQNGRLSPEQKQFLAEIRDLGGLAVVAKSWTDIDRALREGGYVSDGPLFEAPDSPGRNRYPIVKQGER